MDNKTKSKVLYIIPARAGSKGVPNKNIKKLNGKPLIQYTLDEVRKVADIEDICISTDSDEIIKLAESLGFIVHFKRPDHLATDKATTDDVLRHALKFYSVQHGINYDVVVLLQPTSPFRKAQHISEALALYTSNLDMVVSVKETKSNPYYVLFEEESNGLLMKSKKGNFTRRQDCPEVWEYNGAVYIINVSSIDLHDRSEFEKVKKYEMTDMTSLDIDSEYDWFVAEQTIQYLSKQ